MVVDVVDVTEVVVVDETVVVVVVVVAVAAQHSSASMPAGSQADAWHSAPSTPAFVLYPYPQSASETAAMPLPPPSLSPQVAFRRMVKIEL